MEKNTIERFNDWLEDKRIMLYGEENVHALIAEGAKHYYSMCGYVQQDYVTKAQVREGLDEDFDQFYEQSIAMDAIEEFAKHEGIEDEVVILAIEQKKEEFVAYLSNMVDELAEAANDDGED